VNYADVENPGSPDADVGEEMGFFECLMSDLVSSRGMANVNKPLKCRKSGGRSPPVLRVLVEEVRAVKGEAHITLGVRGMANRAGWFSSNVPYATLSKLREDGHWVLLARTEAVQGMSMPRWKPLCITMSRLCNGDTNRPLRVTVEHAASSTESKQVGFLEVPVEKLLKPGYDGKLKHPRGKPKVCGIISSFSPKIVAKPSFMEYMQGGLQIGLCVGIDFTASNGEPSNPASLHAQPVGGGVATTLNAYERAIAAVGAVLAPYDADGMFACYGYGAALPPNYIVRRACASAGCARDTAAPSTAVLPSTADNFPRPAPSLPLSRPRTIQRANLATALHSTATPRRRAAPAWMACWPRTARRCPPCACPAPPASRPS
jgi:hypothetical protein